MVGRGGFSLTLGAGFKEIVVQGAAFTLKGIAERCGTGYVKDYLEGTRIARKLRKGWHYKVADAKRKLTRIHRPGASRGETWHHSDVHYCLASC